MAKVQNGGERFDQIRQKLVDKGFEINGGDVHINHFTGGVDGGFFSICGTPLIEKIKNHRKICLSLRKDRSDVNCGLDVWGVSQVPHLDPIVKIARYAAYFEVDGVVELITSRLAPYPCIKGAVH
uniref:Uncharacterized protein n=1 Tax=Marseillevirus LCMAC101 TaxID=2506602 RepID=A0A481YQ95_9VIRU|nr:MAG: hypothetical protein LCMAC101_00100 [Marseillevirus LCMAC101]